MSQYTKKWIALLLAVWLPLFTGNAQAASVWMQMPHDACDTMQMDDCDQVAVQVDVQADVQADVQHDCADCGLCHLACGAYLTMPEIHTPGVPDTGMSRTPYSFSFQSISATPLLPPPLSRA